MIRLPDSPLSADALTGLADHQRTIDSLPDHAERVARAKKSFSSVNKPGNPIFDEVKATLTRMCSGARRCAYCEDSCADEVEHIRPKSLYPEVVFAWMNYLYACGICNRHKDNHFAVFADDTGLLTNVSRAKKAPVVPPIAGKPVFIDPRIEDPTEFLSLDLRDTFWFLPRARPGTVEHARAEYTIRELRLNLRDILPGARRSAYLDYLNHLKVYVHDKSQGMSKQHLDMLAGQVRARQHPSVWFEMKRQHKLFPELVLPFSKAPEALDW